MNGVWIVLAVIWLMPLAGFISKQVDAVFWLISVAIAAGMTYWLLRYV